MKKIIMLLGILLIANFIYADSNIPDDYLYSDGINFQDLSINNTKVTQGTLAKNAGWHTEYQTIDDITYSFNSTLGTLAMLINNTSGGAGINSLFQLNITDDTFKGLIKFKMYAPNYTQSSGDKRFEIRKTALGGIGYEQDPIARCRFKVYIYNESGIWTCSHVDAIYDEWVNVTINITDTTIDYYYNGVLVNKTTTTLSGLTGYRFANYHSALPQNSFMVDEFGMTENNSDSFPPDRPGYLDNCSNQNDISTNATAYTIRFYDIESKESIATNLQALLYYDDYSYNLDVKDSYNLSLCVYPNYAEFNVSGTLFYDKEDYGSKSLTWENEEFDNETNYLNLYLFNTSSENRGRLIVEVYDDFNNLISGANVKLLEYDTSTNSFIEVAQCYSDTNGECVYDVELNTKFYIVTATAVIDGQAYSQQSTSTGQLVSLDGTTIELHLKTISEYTADDLYSLIITPSNTTLTGNTSYLRATFNDASNTEHTVCIGYYIQNGLNIVEVNSTCVAGSSGIVNFAGGYLLDRSYTWIASIYVLQEDETKVEYERYVFVKVEGSLRAAFPYLLKPIILAVILALLALALYLKNIAIFAIGEMIISPSTIAIYPGLLGGVTMAFLIIIGILILYLTTRKEEPA